MRLAIPEVENQVNQHFGRSSSFAVIEIDNGQIFSLDTVSASGLEHNHVGVAKLLKENQVEVIIAGGIGQGMLDALESQGFKVLKGASGSVKEVAQSYARGEFVSQGDVCNHHGHDHQHHHHE